MEGNLMKYLLIAIAIFVFAATSIYGQEIEVGNEGCSASPLGSTVNVRADSTTSSGILTVLTADSSVPVLFVEGDWYRVFGRVDSEEIFGWVNKDVVKLEGKCEDIPQAPTEATIFVVYVVGTEVSSGANSFTSYEQEFIFCSSKNDCYAGGGSQISNYDYYTINAFTEPYCPPIHAMNFDAGNVLYFYYEDNCTAWENGERLVIRDYSWFPPNFMESYTCFTFNEVSKITNLDGTTTMRTSGVLVSCTDGVHQFNPFTATAFVPESKMQYITLPKLLSDILMPYIR